VSGTTAAQGKPILLRPILLFDDECGVCRFIARQVCKAAGDPASAGIVIRPIGADPQALRSLNPGLDIWAAYATIHVVMPDGTMKLGGEAVAEVFRRLPATAWFAGAFSLKILSVRPFQGALNLAYAILADARPLFGCESCGAPSAWVRPFAWLIKSGKRVFGGTHSVAHPPHFSRLRARKGSASF
jgi:predicted DCC family thiol-disulfide oxidoreductase YuxK